jgi:hypothetical protein
MDDREGVEGFFKGLDWAGMVLPLAEPDERGRWSAGDIGGVWEVLESCCRMFIDAISLSNDVAVVNVVFEISAPFVNGLEADSKLASVSSENLDASFSHTWMDLILHSSAHENYWPRREVESSLETALARSHQEEKASEPPNMGNLLKQKTQLKQWHALFGLPSRRDLRVLGDVSSACHALLVCELHQGIRQCTYHAVGAW